MPQPDTVSPMPIAEITRKQADSAFENSNRVENVALCVPVMALSVRNRQITSRELGKLQVCSDYICRRAQRMRPKRLLIVTQRIIRPAADAHQSGVRFLPKADISR